MKTTSETIKEIEDQFNQGYTRATLYGQDQYEDVFWDEVAEYFETDRIDGYTHGDKIVIRLPNDPDIEVPEPFVKNKRNHWDYVALLFFVIGVVTVIREIIQLVRQYLIP